MFNLLEAANRNDGNPLVIVGKRVSSLLFRLLGTAASRPVNRVVE